MVGLLLGVPGCWFWQWSRHEQAEWRLLSGCIPLSQWLPWQHGCVSVAYTVLWMGQRNPAPVDGKHPSIHRVEKPSGWCRISQPSTIGWNVGLPKKPWDGHESIYIYIWSHILVRIPTMDDHKNWLPSNWSPLMHAVWGYKVLRCRLKNTTTVRCFVGCLSRVSSKMATGNPRTHLDRTIMGHENGSFSASCVWLSLVGGLEHEFYFSIYWE